MCDGPNQRFASLMCWVREYIQKTPMAVRAVIALVERGFAAFAKIPYQDSWSQKELIQLLDELEVANRRTDLTSANYVPANVPDRRAAEWRPAHTIKVSQTFENLLDTPQPATPVGLNR
jgi:hypothetical protein